SLRREICRTTSSLRPGGIVSCSISVSKPHLYFCSANSWIVAVSALIVAASVLVVTGSDMLGLQLPFVNRRGGGGNGGMVPVEGVAGGPDHFSEADAREGGFNGKVDALPAHPHRAEAL